MAEDSPLRALLVVTITALLCSILVSTAAVYLQPIQDAHADLDRVKRLVQLSGLIDDVAGAADLDVIAAYRELTPRLVDLDDGRLEARFDPETFIGRLAADEVQQLTAVPPELDVAGLGSRPRWMTVYTAWADRESGLTIFPVYGQGMWSTIYGYLALEADLNTIADVVFYDLGETAGIGDRIARPEWLADWKGKQLRDEAGELRFNIGTGSAAGVSGDHVVDGIAGATVTVNAVADLVRYWFGKHGYGPALDAVREAGPP